MYFAFAIVAVVVVHTFGFASFELPSVDCSHFMPPQLFAESEPNIFSYPFHVPFIFLEYCDMEAPRNILFFLFSFEQ